MNLLPTDKQAQVVRCLAEGNSINATARMTGVGYVTILRLIARVGAACERFHDTQVRNLGTTRVQCDEVWSFVGMKQRNVPPELQGVIGVGSVWTWTALDADSRMLVSWMASNRSQEAADAFIADLKARTSMRLQITSDGYSAYLDAIAKAFPNRGDVDYAEEIKTYTNSAQPGMSPNHA